MTIDYYKNSICSCYVNRLSDSYGNVKLVVNRLTSPREKLPEENDPSVTWEAGDLSAFETFTVYKFSINYPPVCRVEFNPKSRREAGDVVFHFPDREKVFVSWGALEKAEKKFATAEEQAEHSLKVVKKSSNVKKMEKTSSDTVLLNSHKAAYNHIKLDEMPPGLFLGRRTIAHETHSIHIHCDKSARYFVIYSMLSPKAPEDFGDLFMAMAKSFKCH